jgi:hypothetical protein
MKLATTPESRATAVSRYTYHLFSSRSDDGVILYLYDANADVIGHVCFVPDDQPLPPAVHSRGIVEVYFPRSRFPEVIDMLRNEGPIELRWAGPLDSSLSTGLEPVGEGERVR